jgi:hypothetical protein
MIFSGFSKTISKIVTKYYFQKKIWMVMNIITCNKIKWSTDLGSTQVALCSHYKILTPTPLWKSSKVGSCRKLLQGAISGYHKMLHFLHLFFPHFSTNFFLSVKFIVILVVSLTAGKKNKFFQSNLSGWIKIRRNRRDQVQWSGRPCRVFLLPSLSRRPGRANGQVRIAFDPLLRLDQLHHSPATLAGPCSEAADLASSHSHGWM